MNLATKIAFASIALVLLNGICGTLGFMHLSEPDNLSVVIGAAILIVLGLTDCYIVSTLLEGKNDE